MHSIRSKRVILYLSVIAILAYLGCTQGLAQNQGKEPVQPEGSKFTVKGKINYAKSLGGYFVLGMEPGGELFIVNKDPKVLEELYKSKKVLTIEGRLTPRGAEYLFIEKIDGKDYAGTEEPALK